MLDLKVGDKVYLINSHWPEEVATLVYIKPPSEGDFFITHCLFKYERCDPMRHSGNLGDPNVALQLALKDGQAWWGEQGYGVVKVIPTVEHKQYLLVFEE